jgi:chromatin remodeling complex protein RSC6
MSKRNVTESLDKLKGMIEGNDSISVQLQSKLLKQVGSISKHIKAPAKTEKPDGSSQFEKKLPISPEIAAFAGWDPESVHSRVEITSAIWNYVKENNLRQSNKRISKVDETLKALLGIEEETIAYPKIQKYIGKHLRKKSTDTKT